MKIELTSFDESWQKEFAAERDLLNISLGTDVKVIEHIGSTSIPVDLSKPVIDLLIAVDPFEDLNYYQARLDENIYKYVETGMKQRYLFNKYNKDRWTHNVHIIKYTPEFHQLNEILFRDYIKNRKDLIHEYSLLKKTLGAGTSDIEEYTKGKTGFIQKVVDRARTEKGLPLVDVWE